MAKRGSNQKSGSRNPKKMKSTANVDLQDMDDEVDLFHKQRDKIPLDMYDDSAESEDDDEQPVFNYKGADEDDSEGEDDSADDEYDEIYDKSFNKIVKTQKYLKAKYGNLEDEDLDDAEEDTVEKRTVWGRSKSIYYDADNIDFELQSSDEESDLEAEEVEAMRLRKETLMSMTMEDFGLEDDEEVESDVEPNLESRTVDALKMEFQKDEGLDNRHKCHQESVSSLSVKMSSARAPLEEKLKQKGVFTTLESNNQKTTKHTLQRHNSQLETLEKLAYKSRTVDALKMEVQKVKGLDNKYKRHESVSSQSAKMLRARTAFEERLRQEGVFTKLESNKQKGVFTTLESNNQKTTKHTLQRHNSQLETLEKLAYKSRTVEVQKVKGLDNKHKRHLESVSSQSAKMLRARAALEERLRQEGVFTKLESNKQKVTTLESNKQKTKKHILQRHNSRFETLDDFRDDDVDVDASAPTLSKKISQILNMNKGNKKMVSGDEDLPQRDSLEERRRKHEIRVLSRARVGSVEDDGENAAEESKDKLNNIQERKLASKDSKALAIPSEPETVDGRRLITQQMEKNRGLTPYRKKLAKNPRKKYKLKHEKAQKRLGGQVRQMRFPQGPYGGEANGINDSVTHSIRFKW